MKIAYFGSSRFSVYVLEEMTTSGLAPACVVSTPDKPVGRHQDMTPTPVKSWAISHGIKCFDPAKLDQAFADTLKQEGCDVFVVASYGKIIPQRVLDLPQHKTLNIHPSLLPRYRGAAPLQSAMLDDTKQTGVTIMHIDEQVDHGPIVAQKEISISEWPTYEIFEENMAREGGRLLASVLADWIAGKITEKEQDHASATFTKKISKEDALIDLVKGDPYENFRKIQAYHGWPAAYFMAERSGMPIRVKVTTATFKDNILTIERVIPEGKKEMPYKDFLAGYAA